MAQFTNTQRIDTINTITNDFKQRMDSPFNIQQNSKPYIVDYWNQNLANTTTDDASHLIMASVGRESPIRLCRIDNAILYGLPQFQVDLEVGDFGLESDAYSGESTILPNTFIPYAGDYFSIKHADSFRTFQVTKATPDTLPNGANYYKIEFTYSTKTPEMLNKLTIETYRFIYDNVGTNYSCVIRSSEYDLIHNIENKLSTLKKYYCNLFYRDNVQTFVYKHNGLDFYDPYMIEFLLRNGSLNNDRNYAYVAHALPISKTFAIEYDRTFFRMVEELDKSWKINTGAIAQYIDNKISLFCFRSTNYYQIQYGNMQYASPVPVVDIDLYNRIVDNNPYMEDNINLSYKNIIIDYFNQVNPSTEIIEGIVNMDYEDSITLFYNIPIVIYILERYIKQMISKSPKSDISTKITYK